MKQSIPVITILILFVVATELRAQEEFEADSAGHYIGAAVGLGSMASEAAFYLLVQGGAYQSKAMTPGVSLGMLLWGGSDIRNFGSYLFWAVPQLEYNSSLRNNKSQYFVLGVGAMLSDGSHELIDEDTNYPNYYASEEQNESLVNFSAAAKAGAGITTHIREHRQVRVEAFVIASRNTAVVMISTGIFFGK